MLLYMEKKIKTLKKIKNLELWRLSSNIWVGTKYNHMYPYQRKVQRGLPQMEEQKARRKSDYRSRDWSDMTTS